MNGSSSVLKCVRGLGFAMIFFAGLSLHLAVAFAQETIPAAINPSSPVVNDPVTDEECRIYSQYLQHESQEAPLPRNYALGALDLSGSIAVLTAQARTLPEALNSHSLYNTFLYSGFLEGRRKMPLLKMDAFMDLSEKSKKSFLLSTALGLPGKQVLSWGDFAAKFPGQAKKEASGFARAFFVAADPLDSLERYDFQERVALSRIGFDKERTQAVFYAMYDSVGEYVIFVKDSGQWVLAASVWYPLSTKEKTEKN